MSDPYRLQHYYLTLSTFAGTVLVIEGSNAIVDPQECLRAPGNLKKRLNILWRDFETLNGWDAPKDMWPQLQAICDAWEHLSGKE